MTHTMSLARCTYSRITFGRIQDDVVADFSLLLLGASLASMVSSIGVVQNSAMQLKANQYSWFAGAAGSYRRPRECSLCRDSCNIYCHRAAAEYVDLGGNKYPVAHAFKSLDDASFDFRLPGINRPYRNSLC